MNGKTPKIHIESAKNRPNSNLRLENSRFRSLRSIFYEFRSSLMFWVFFLTAVRCRQNTGNPQDFVDTGNYDHEGKYGGHCCIFKRP